MSADLEQSRLFHLLVRGKVAEAGVEMVIGLAGQDLEWIFLRGRRVARFRGWNKGRDGVETLAFQGFAIELGFTGRRFEATLGEGEECSFLAGLRRGMPRLYVRRSCRKGNPGMREV